MQSFDSGDIGDGFGGRDVLFEDLRQDDGIALGTCPVDRRVGAYRPDQTIAPGAGGLGEQALDADPVGFGGVDAVMRAVFRQPHGEMNQCPR
ncbi:Uncharacterised protein [Mycobacteroides abscessus subsp. massiliense]|nr:Uncharacterised protein [Mycobacteroides abscessus subsp. massiliense]